MVKLPTVALAEPALWEAASALGISPATITRMKAAGAPVHHWGPPGSRMYRIVLPELIAWMEAQGEKTAENRARKMTLEEMREARHRSVKKMYL